MAQTNQGLVLQGYFRGERFRGAAPGAVASPWSPVTSAMSAPRPELLPSFKKIGVAQSKFDAAPRAGTAWSTAPRPELLPVKMRAMAAQARAAPSHLSSAGPALPTAWPGAPRPALLPGMGAPRSGLLSGPVQRRGATGGTTAPMATGQLRLIGAGRPLEAGLRGHMESFFDADFSTVRVHEGPAAPAIGALAFTLGETLVFAPGQYDPTTREGVALLGHELAHVVQQRAGRVGNPYGSGVAIVQDPGLEAEADELGRRVAEQLWSRQGVDQAAWRPIGRAVIQPAWDGKQWAPEEFGSKKNVAKPKPKPTPKSLFELITAQSGSYRAKAIAVLNRLDPQGLHMEKTICFMWRRSANDGVEYQYAVSGPLSYKQRTKIGADPTKNTICAEEVFFVRFGKQWMYSASYDRKNGWKPACQQGSKGGCKNLLLNAAISDIFKLM